VAGKPWGGKAHNGKREREKCEGMNRERGRKDFIPVLLFSHFQRRVCATIVTKRRLTIRPK